MREAEIILGAMRFLLDHHASQIGGYDPSSAQKAREFSAEIGEILTYEQKHAYKTYEEDPPPPPTPAPAPAPAAEPAASMPAAEARPSIAAATE